MKTIRIGEHIIGEGHPAFIIAEAGANHDRNFDQAIRLVDIAAQAKAQAVKFQTYSAESMYSTKTPEIESIKNKLRPGETIVDLIRRIEIPRDWHRKLDDACNERGVLFMSTPFDLAAVKQLEETGVLAYKIASFEITHLPLLKAVGQTGKPVILSTGMASLGDIELALETLAAAGNDQVALLHCSSLYPADYADLNLRAMDTMRQAFGCPVGFSDHTMGITSDIAAVARGADIIEKHYTIDRSLPGPDHGFALEPDELVAMVQAIRDTEAALGSPAKGRTVAEEEHYHKARRSLVAARDIPKGKTIEEEDLAVKRPGFGIHPRNIELLVGRKPIVDIAADDILLWEMFLS